MVGSSILAGQKLANIEPVYACVEGQEPADKAIEKNLS